MKNDSNADEFISEKDGDNDYDGPAENNSQNSDNDNSQIGKWVGPGRTKPIRTGKPGSSRKHYNDLWKKQSNVLIQNYVCKPRIESTTLL